MRSNINIAAASVTLAALVAVSGAVIGAGAAAAAPKAAATSSLAAFTLVAPTSQVPSGLLARAVIAAGAGCPLLTGTYTPTQPSAPQEFAYQLRLREKPELAGAAYAAIDVCELALPKNALTAMIGKTSIPANLPARIDEIALLGDTGCRVTSWEVQDCANTSNWPLARISRNIAKSRPDVTIHLGDYFYRETGCPQTQQDFCAASPPAPSNLPAPGNAYGWIADALIPMQPLFDAAPMLLLRGNHESCTRGGIGFFLIFSPDLTTALQCAPTLVNGVVTVPTNDITPTWHTKWTVGATDATAHTLDLEIIDNAYGNDNVVDAFAATQRPSYVAAAKNVAKTKPDEAWLLTHRPIFGMVTTQFAGAGSVWSSADQTAASQGLLGNYNLLLASHIHVAQVTTIPGQPSQLVIGNSGTYLDPVTGYPKPTYGPLSNPDGTALSPLAAPYPAPSSVWTDVRFGYVIATPKAGSSSWLFDQRDQRGQSFAKCDLVQRTVSCK